MTSSVLLFILFLFVGSQLVGAFKKIKSEEGGLILRLGRFHRVAGSGVVFLIPGVDKLVIFSQAPVVKKFGADCISVDNLLFFIEGEFTYKLFNPEKALTMTRSYESVLNETIVKELRESIGSSRYEEIFFDLSGLSKTVTTAFSGFSRTFGVEILDVRINPLPDKFNFNQHPETTEVATGRSGKGRNET